MAQILSQNQTLHGYVAYNWSCGNFCDILAYFDQNLVAMATSLRPCNQKWRLWIGQPRKPPVISNHILASLSLIEMHLYAVIAILVPKLVAMVTPLCSLCTWVSQMNSPMAQTLSQNQTLHGYVAYYWSYDHFCDFLAYFGQNLVAMATPLRPLQSEMSSSDWSTTKTPCYK